MSDQNSGTTFTVQQKDQQSLLSAAPLCKKTDQRRKGRYFNEKILQPDARGAFKDPYARVNSKHLIAVTGRQAGSLMFSTESRRT